MEEAECWVIFDTETTGLHRWDRVISIAASCRNAAFTSLVRPPRPIPAASTAVHGITDERVRDEQPWYRVGSAFWKWVSAQAAGKQRLVLVAHNATFDMRMLRSETKRLWALPPLPPVYVVDTLKVCRAVLKGLPDYKQATVYQHLFGDAPADQHDAAGDVAALRRICEHPSVGPHLVRHQVELLPFEHGAPPNT